MKRLSAFLLAIVVAWLVYNQSTQRESIPSTSPAAQQAHFPASAARADEKAIQQAFREHRSNLQVEAQGTVAKVLKDDNDGSRHQRFIIALPGQTVLVAHNIDLAERVAGLEQGETITVYGEYVWNEQGGVLHWTHRDPAARHAAGWIKYRGRIYQ